MSLLVNSVTSFSNAPLVSIFYIGVAISLFALAYIVYLVTHWLFLTKPHERMDISHGLYLAS